MITTANLMLEGALDAIQWRLGPVFPVHGIRPDGCCTCGDPKCVPPDGSPGKHPRIKDWYATATTDPTTVRGWFGNLRRFAHSNVGLATGYRVTVLDVDPRHGGFESLAKLEAGHGPLPRTVRQITGSDGEHRLFRTPPGALIGNSAGVVGRGLDIRGVGGQIVIAPSLHFSGNRYSWDPEAHPAETPVAGMPDWLVALALQKGSGARARRAAGGSLNAALAAGVNPPGRGAEYWRTLLAEGAPEGRRNTAVCELTGYLLHLGVVPSLALKQVLAWNRLRCPEPLDDDEVITAASSIIRRELERAHG